MIDAPGVSGSTLLKETRCPVVFRPSIPINHCQHGQEHGNASPKHLRGCCLALLFLSLKAHFTENGGPRTRPRRVSESGAPPLFAGPTPHSFLSYRVVFAPTRESLKSAAPRTVPFRQADRQEDKSPVLFEVKAGGMPDTGRRLGSLPAIRHCREV